MNDADFEVQKARVSGLLRKWLKLLGFHQWRLEFVYEREQTIETDTGAGTWRTTLTCSAKWQYMDAKITVYLPAIESMSDDDLEEAVVHEYGHVFLNETRQGGKDWLAHEERVAVMLAKAFISVRDAAKEESTGILPERAVDLGVGCGV